MQLIFIVMYNNCHANSMLVSQYYYKLLKYRNNSIMNIIISLIFKSNSSYKFKFHFSKYSKVLASCA